MTDKTPERIWHAFDRRGKISGCPDAHVKPCSEVAGAYQEYVHADLHAAVVAERDQLRAYAREATIALTEKLNVGGSEFFAGRIGEFYKADVPYCLKAAERRFESRNRLEVMRLKSQIKDLEAKLTELERHNG